MLDLMMPEVNGFDVVEALSERSRARRAFRSSWSPPSRSPREDRARLNGYVTTIMEKAEFDRDRFIAEVRRAMSGRAAGAA